MGDGTDASDGAVRDFFITGEMDVTEEGRLFRETIICICRCICICMNGGALEMNARVGKRGDVGCVCMDVKKQME